MRSLKEFYRSKKIWTSFILFFSIITTLTGLIFPYILKDIIDGIKGGFAYQDLMWFVIVLSAIGFAKALFNALLPYTRGRTNELFLLKERENVFSRILNQNHSFSSRFPVGDALQRVDHDLNEFSWFACSGIFRPLEGMIILVIALFFMCRINIWLTVISVLPVSLAAVGWHKIGPHMFKFYHAWRALIAKSNNHLQSSFSGIKLVKSYSIEKQSHEQYQNILKDRVNASIKVIRIETLTDSLFTSIEEIGVIMVLFAGGIFVIKNYITIGEFIAFNAYVVLLLDPMIRIGNFFVSRKRAQVQNERIEELKDFPIQVKDTGQLITSDDGRIKMKNVTFQYSEKGYPVLKNINLEIPFGRKTGLAGTVGSGKTTVIKLLMRLADPSAGQILTGKTDIRDLKLADLRAMFGYVPQDPVLFSDTIYNNIAFGRTFSDQEIERAIKLAQLERFIKNAPKGLQEMVGEKGLKLSGGEKQRVAIARALIGRPKILLFDDATSNLDAETEKQLVDQLTQESDITLVIVSHRLSILSVCDNIFVLDKGEIVEQGTHQALLKNKNLYWDLYKHQLG